MDISKVKKTLLIVASVVFVSLLNVRVTYAGGTCPVVINAVFPSAINIDPTLPVGSLIGRAQSQIWPAALSSCSLPIGKNIAGLYQGVGVPNGNIYPTGIPGVGYRGYQVYYRPGQEYWPITRYGEITPQQYRVESNGLVLEFVKTGPIKPGQFSVGEIMTLRYNGVLGLIVKNASAIDIKPVVPACTPDTAVVPVVLPTILQGDLKKVGDTAGEKNFSIGLTCKEPSNISLLFDGDVTNSTSAVYRNTDSITGKTIGIQIMRNNAPVPNGAGKYIPLGTVSGSISTAFSAQYYALSNAIDVGNVSGVAQVSIIYN